MKYNKNYIVNNKKNNKNKKKFMKIQNKVHLFQIKNTMKRKVVVQIFQFMMINLKMKILNKMLQSKIILILKEQILEQNFQKLQ